MSKILYISSGISRRLNIIPSFLYSVPGIYQTPLKEEIINEDGGRVGIVEPVDRRAITFRFDGSSSYQDRFFNNGIYENTISEVSSYGASYLVKEVIDYIIQTYPTYLVSSASSVTWYDVYRRIPANRLGELFYDCGPEFITAISTGYRGITIRNVLNIGAGLVYQLLPNDERCIITLENR